MGALALRLGLPLRARPVAIGMVVSTPSLRHRSFSQQESQRPELRIPNCRSRLSHNKLAAFRADHACSFADRTSRVRDATALHSGVRICVWSFRTWSTIAKITPGSRLYRAHLACRLRYSRLQTNFGGLSTPHRGARLVAGVYGRWVFRASRYVDGPPPTQEPCVDDLGCI